MHSFQYFLKLWTGISPAFLPIFPKVLLLYLNCNFSSIFYVPLPSSEARSISLLPSSRPSSRQLDVAGLETRDTSLLPRPLSVCTNCEDCWFVWSLITPTKLLGACASDLARICSIEKLCGWRRITDCVFIVLNLSIRIYSQSNKTTSRDDWFRKTNLNIFEILRWTQISSASGGEGVVSAHILHSAFSFQRSAVSACNEKKQMMFMFLWFPKISHMWDYF